MVNYTKQAIVDTFVQILNQKPLKNITVTEIIKECGLSRNTFYYHFQDIFSLVEYWFHEEYEHVKKTLTDSDTLREGYILVLDVFKDNKNALKHLYESGKEAPLTRYLSLAFDAAIMCYMDKYFSDTRLRTISLSRRDFNFLARYHKYAIIGFIIEWLNSSSDEELESLLERLSHLSAKSILLYLNQITSGEDQDLPDERG